MPRISIGAMDTAKKNSLGKKVKKQRGSGNVSKLCDKLPDWAQTVAREAMNSDIEAMKCKLKDANTLSKVLRELIKRKQKVRKQVASTRKGDSDSHAVSDESSSPTIVSK